MKISNILVFLLLFTGSLLFFPWLNPTISPAPAKENDISNPGGSPFAPGEEPSITHTVSLFWITAGDIDRTEISVKTPGSMPVQIRGWVPKVDMPGWTKGEPVSEIIAPNCNQKFVFLRADSKRKTEQAYTFRHTGMGTLNILIHGFSSKDYQIIPQVEVKYFKGETLMGITVVKGHTISDKIRKEESRKNKKQTGKSFTNNFPLLQKNVLEFELYPDTSLCFCKLE